MSKPRSPERWRQFSPRQRQIRTAGCLASYLLFFVAIGVALAVFLPFGRVLDIVIGVLTVVAGVIPLPEAYREGQRMMGPRNSP